MSGREEVRAWIWKTMESFPGSHMTAFPSLWSVIDEPTSRIICELDNPMRDPGDGTIISATNISIITYAGDGLWRRQEDIYNPLRFVQATMKWCRKAQELGTLPDEAASWMRQYGRPEVSAQPKLVIGANGFLGSHVTRQLVADGHRRPGRWCGRAPTPSASTTWTSRGSSATSGTTTRCARRWPAVDDVYYCVVDTRGWLRDPAPLFRTNVEGTRNVLDVAQEMPACGSFVFTSSYVTVGRRRGHRATEDDVIAGERGLTPYVRSRVAGREHGAAARAGAWPARRRDVRVDHLRRRRLGPHPARRDHRRRRVRQAAVRDERHRAGGRRRRRRRPCA